MHLHLAHCRQALGEPEEQGCDPRKVLLTYWRLGGSASLPEGLSKALAVQRHDVLEGGLRGYGSYMQ